METPKNTPPRDLETWILENNVLETLQKVGVVLDKIIIPLAFLALIPAVHRVSNAIIMIIEKAK